MSKWYGWAGTILRVDLTTNKVVKVPLDKELAKGFIGGRGVNSKMLFDGTEAGIDAFSPENLLIFGTGPLNGTISPNSGRYTVTAKSPMTGILGDANSGGFWGPELKFAGYDHIVVRGRAKEPVYLWIDNDAIEIRKAAHLWGADTWETDKALKQEIGDDDIQVTCIGPAGERLVRFACVINNLARAAGRTGMGAVMGSKNLKAIAVRGNKDIEVARPRLFDKAVERVVEGIQSSPMYEIYRRFGTTFLVMAMNEVGNLGYRNSRSGTWERADEVGGEAFLEKYAIKHKGCFGCRVSCSHYWAILEGEYGGTRGEGAEYNTIQSFGPSCGNANLASILYASNLVNKLGIDSITAGMAIAWAMECYERGIITAKDTDGIELEWGDHRVIIELLRKIASREGFGDLLAEGPLKAARTLHKGEDYVLHVKGLPPPGNDLRSKKGGALSFVTSSRGADHLRGLPVVESRSIDPTSTVGKASLVIWNEHLCAVADSLEICKFVTAWALVSSEIRFKEFSELFSAATGIDADEGDIVKVGERIINVERAFSVREGVSRKDDKPPRRFMEESTPSGPYKGQRLTRKELEEMLDEYYELRGWDTKTGIPTPKTLEGLGLYDVRVALEKQNFFFEA